MSVVSSVMTKVTPKKGKALPTVGQATQGLMAAVLEEAIAEIVTLLRENTSKILPALNIIRGNDLVPAQVDEVAPADEKPFHRSYTKLQRLPKEFARELLTAEADRPEITIEIFEQLERGAEGSTRAAFYYAHKVLPATAWPKFALDKGVFRATFKARHADCGNLMKTMPLITKGDKLCIDWNSWGVYKLLPDGKVAKTQVHHVKLQKTANLPITIGAEDEYLIQNNWDDLRATLKYKTLLTPILNMFDASVKHEVEGLRSGLGVGVRVGVRVGMGVWWVWLMRVCVCGEEGGWVGEPRPVLSTTLPGNARPRS